MVADYFARLGYALREGRHAAETLVLHPVESAFSLYEPLKFRPGQPERMENAPLEKLNAALVEVLRALAESCRSYDLGDEQMLGRTGSVGEDGTLRVGAMSYRAVILPQMLTLRRSTLRLLDQFRRAGGTVLAAGAMPERVDGVPDKAAREFAEAVASEGKGGDWLAALDAALPRRLHIEPSNGPRNELLSYERELEEGHLLFLCNRDRSRPRRLSLHRDGARRVRELDPVTGRMSTAAEGKNGGAARVEISMAPGETKLYLFEEFSSPAGQDAAVVSTDAENSKGLGESGWDEVELDGPWRLQRLGPNALTLDFCRYMTEEQPYSEPLPVIAVQQILCARGYRGPLWLDQV